jgi:hypothetical protein
MVVAGTLGRYIKKAVGHVSITRRSGLFYSRLYMVGRYWWLCNLKEAWKRGAPIYPRFTFPARRVKYEDQLARYRQQLESSPSLSDNVLSPLPPVVSAVPVVQFFQNVHDLIVVVGLQHGKKSTRGAVPAVLASFVRDLVRARFSLSANTL